MNAKEPVWYKVVYYDPEGHVFWSAEYGADEVESEEELLRSIRSSEMKWVKKFLLGALLTFGDQLRRAAEALDNEENEREAVTDVVYLHGEWKKVVPLARAAAFGGIVKVWKVRGKEPSRQRRKLIMVHRFPPVV